MFHSLHGRGTKGLCCENRFGTLSRNGHRRVLAAPALHLGSVQPMMTTCCWHPNPASWMNSLGLSHQHKGCPLAILRLPPSPWLGFLCLECSMDQSLVSSCLSSWHILPQAYPLISSSLLVATQFLPLTLKLSPTSKTGYSLDISTTTVLFPLPPSLLLANSSQPAASLPAQTQVIFNHLCLSLIQLNPIDSSPKPCKGIHTTTSSYFRY